MKGVYIISNSLINLSMVKAICGGGDFVYFDMVTSSGSDYSFNGYDFNKVLNDIEYMQQIGAKVWEYNYEEVSD